MSCDTAKPPVRGVEAGSMIRSPGWSRIAGRWRAEGPHGLKTEIQGRGKAVGGTVQGARCASFHEIT